MFVAVEIYFRPANVRTPPTTVLTSSLPPRYLPTVLCTMTPLAFSRPVQIAALIPNSSIPTPIRLKFCTNSPIAVQPDVPKICRTSLFWASSARSFGRPTLRLMSPLALFFHGLYKLRLRPRKRVSCPRAHIPSRPFQIGDALPHHRQPGAIEQTG